MSSFSLGGGCVSGVLVSSDLSSWRSLIDVLTDLFDDTFPFCVVAKQLRVPVRCLQSVLAWLY